MQQAIQELINKRTALMSEKNRAMQQFDEEISEMDSAIAILSGKKVWEAVSEERFDDENPNVMKGSYEEM